MNNLEIKLDKYIETNEIKNAYFEKNLEKMDAKLEKMDAKIEENRKESAANISEMRKEARDDRRALARYMLALSTIFISAVITIAIKIF